ncbi:MAG: DEAD/DEAH box helicase, partial [Alphaproteobacteria bacterium]|nr:DEAD/DEAH box helicase [Alphaproteobacteria bacterium]
MALRVPTRTKTEETAGSRAVGCAWRVPVMLPYPFAGPFDYRVPDGLDPRPGDVVRVPLNNRETVGVVWDRPSADPLSPVPMRIASPPVAAGKLKPIAAILATPPLPAPLRRFIDWVASYTLAPPGEVMAMALRALPGPDLPRFGFRPADPLPPHRESDARRRVLAVLADGLPRAAAALAEAASVGDGVVRGLAKGGVLVRVPLGHTPPFARPDRAHARAALSPEQSLAADALSAAVRARRFSVTLLDGVTGSGKTEVYLEAIAACLSAGRQTLVLLPEIALSAQFLARFARRFGVAPAVWHSDLTEQRRRITWRAVAEGRADVVVGARSALFLPFADLGLVVVDEEHEAAFKQEDGVIYHARDQAVVRARLSGAPAVLVSAAPSLETVANVASGRYRRVRLPTRHA